LSQWNPEPPQGFSSEQEQIIIGRPPIPRFGAPQGVGAVTIREIMDYENSLIMAYEESDNWFDLAFQQRIPITINPLQVPSTQSDFPLLINSIFTDLIGAVEAELRFAGEDNIQLEYEIQFFDDSTGELIAWIKKPTIDDDDITFVYFDNPGASDEQNPGAVWDSNYVGVYHMQANSDDSTSNAQDLTDTGVTTVVAKIGNGADYNGTVTSFSQRNPFDGTVPSIAATFECWISSIGTQDGILSYASTGNTNDFLVVAQESLSLLINGFAAAFGTSFNDGVLHHLVVTWLSSNGEAKAYLDGVLVSTLTVQTGHSIVSGGSVVLGQDQDTIGAGFQPGQALDGTLDEVRWSDIVRDADYVTTSFNNQDDTSTFYAISASENVSVATFTPMGYETT